MDMSPRRVAVVAVCIGIVGVVLRLVGVSTLELWSDEARWCDHLLSGTGTWFRPAGYMWLTRQILNVVGVSEAALRSLSLMAGIVLLPVFFVVARRAVTRPVIALLAMWLLAIHPVAVAMSKEFKPYIVEALVHAVLIGLTLAALEQPQRRRWLIFVVLTSTLAPFFAWTIVFAYPAVYAVLGLGALRERRWRDVSILVLGCVMTLAVLVGIFLARLASKKPATEYWGKKYDVFYVGDSLLGYLAWFLRKTAEVASFPGRVLTPWPAWVEWLIQGVVVIVVAVGVMGIVRKRRATLAALLLGPWGVMLVFNTVGAWPYGVFRTNTFLLVYTILLFAVGVDAMTDSLAARARLRPLAVVVALAWMGLTVPYRLEDLTGKGPGTLTSESSVRAALERVFEAEEGRPVSEPLDDERFYELVVAADAARKAQTDVVRISDLPDDAGVRRPLLVLDGHACTSMRYYRDRDVGGRRAFEEWLPGHFVTLCTPYARRPYAQTLKALRGRDFWLVTGKTGFPAITRKVLSEMCLLDGESTLPPSTHVIRCRSTTRAPTSRLQTGIEVVDEAEDDEDE
jgi:hypothetical protein